MILIPKNWAEFQHYKDRAPPWIKLHKKLLDDRVYQSLPLASRALAPMLWLLASESKDGSFDGAHEELAFRLRTNIKDIAAGLKPLIDKGFFHVVQGDSAVLADRQQLAVPETEGETEKETKTEAPEGVSISVWKDFLKIRAAKKAPMTDTALAGLKREIAKAGLTMQQGIEMCCERSWQGFKADWLTEAPGKFTKPAPNATVPGKAERDPELVKAEQDAKNRAPMPEAIRELAARLKTTPQGASA
jgi:hypothetical protein